mgnify:CR=1 FL=1
MAENEKTSYPKIPMKHWWVIRKKFIKSIPSEVTAGYLATTLEMKEESAKANILPSLIYFGIIDEDGKPTELAVKWRDDEQYSQVCEDIKKEIYPQELLDALPGPNPDRVAVNRWFANAIGVGIGAAKKMGLVYRLLCEADVSKGQDYDIIPGTTSRKKTSKEKSISKNEIIAKSKNQKAESQHRPVVQTKQSPFATPNIHIDLQIHISPDASPDQIDKIFASMAKHLYKNRD